MNKCICSVCKTENELHYEYCKNCGAKLQKEDGTNFEQPYKQENYQYTSRQQNAAYTAPQTSQNSEYARHTEPRFEQSYDIAEIDGVKTEDLAAYIGPNNKRIIDKFSRMELTGSKVSWCWPAAIFAFLLGPCGAALWFIYRKMYKLGIILLAVGFLLSGIVTVIGGSGTTTFENISNDFFENFYAVVEEDVFEEIPENEIIPEIEEGNKYDKYSTLRADIAAILDDAVTLASIALAGLFSMFAYKKHTIKKIKHYNIVNASERYHQIGLMAVGGTSSGMVFLAAFAYSFLYVIVGKILLLFV